MLNLATTLTDSATHYPEKEAFVLGDIRLTYSQVDKQANQVANGLHELGIAPGDKVALSCPNIPYFPIIYFGILKAGAVVVPLNILLKHNEVSYHLDDSHTKAYFLFEGTPELAMGKEGHLGFENSNCDHLIFIPADPKAQAPYPEVENFFAFMAKQSEQFDSPPTQEDDTALIIYTSGTTGRPKGAELTHSNIFFNSLISRDLLDLEKEDVYLMVLPLFHIFGQVVLMTTGVYRAATGIMLPRFVPEDVFTTMEKERVTVFAGVPTMYWGLLNCQNTDQFNLDQIAKDLRICVSGGASLPVKVLEDFEEKYKVAILEGYGMSEGSPVVTFNQLKHGRKPGSIGKAVWGVDVQIVDENDEPVPNGEKGELIFRGHNVMKGYFQRPEVNQLVLRNGWMHSGDVAIKDDDGYYYIVDRTKDMVIRGGLNVYPREVEEVMMKHPAISLVAVIGIPDEKYGEEIKACVVLKEGHTATTEEIIQWTENEIAAYKYPRVVEIRDSLPMTATGKILKKELRAEIEAS